MTANVENARLLPYAVIQKAADGNVDAINAVLKHYEGYIAKLCPCESFSTNTATPDYE